MVKYQWELLVSEMNELSGKGEHALEFFSILTQQLRLFMKPILGALLPVDVENEDFWTDLENHYLPNGDLNLATADDWRTAYIMVCFISTF